MPESAMRVLLVDVPSVSPNQINLGLASIGAVLKQRGHEVRVLDLNNLNVPGSRGSRLKKALEWRPEVFAVSLFPACTYNYNHAERVLRNARELLGRECLFVVGGIGVTIDVSAALKRFGGLADILVHGEGEVTLAEVIERRAAGGDLGGILGTALAVDGKEIINPERPLIEDLDSLPFADYRVFDSVGETIAAKFGNLSLELAQPFVVGRRAHDRSTHPTHDTHNTENQSTSHPFSTKHAFISPERQRPVRRFTWLCWVTPVADTRWFPRIRPAGREDPPSR